jgi:hypothetical protein
MAYITTHDETTDHCVVCNKPTIHKRSDNVNYRSHYIEGAGQLCPECFVIEEKNSDLLQNIKHGSPYRDF